MYRVSLKIDTPFISVFFNRFNSFKKEPVFLSINWYYIHFEISETMTTCFFTRALFACGTDFLFSDPREFHLWLRQSRIWYSRHKLSPKHLVTVHNMYLDTSPVLILFPHTSSTMALQCFPCKTACWNLEQALVSQVYWRTKLDISSLYSNTIRCIIFLCL